MDKSKKFLKNNPVELTKHDDMHFSLRIEDDLDEDTKTRIKQGKKAQSKIVKITKGEDGIN